MTRLECKETEEISVASAAADWNITRLECKEKMLNGISGVMNLLEYNQIGM